MNKIEVLNIKCHGCSKSIKKTLAKEGFKNIKVDSTCQIVEFEGDEKRAEKILLKMGYPKAGSPEARSLHKKAKSYLSCVVGRVSK